VYYGLFSVDRSQQMRFVYTRYLLLHLAWSGLLVLAPILASSILAAQISSDFLVSWLFLPLGLALL
jgi:hypothetical protein